MAIVRWEPAGDLGSLQREIDRVFSSFLGGQATRSAARGWMPAIDLYEHEKGYVLSADLPGVSAEDVAIDVERNVLTLSGARTRDAGEHAAVIRSERGYGSFRRELTLPDGVDPDEIVASFDRGVLEIRIPKPAAARPRRVSIDVGGTPTMIDGGQDADGGEGTATKESAGAPA